MSVGRVLSDCRTILRRCGGRIYVAAILTIIPVNLLGALWSQVSSLLLGREQSLLSYLTIETGDFVGLVLSLATGFILSGVVSATRAIRPRRCPIQREQRTRRTDGGCSTSLRCPLR